MNEKQPRNTLAAAVPGGNRHVTKSLRPGVRSALVGSVAVVAVLSLAGQAGADVCTVQPNATYLCSGDQSAGVDLQYSSAVKGASVTGLTKNITPASGTDGISVLSSGGADIDVDLGTNAVQATGSGADGVTVVEWGSGIVDLTVNGNVSSVDGDGIYTTANGGAVTLNAQGTISGGTDGVEALSYGTGVVDLTLGGSVSGLTGAGVKATTQGAIVLTSTADISTGSNTVAGGNAIDLRGFDKGGVVIDQTGDITANAGDAVFVTTSAGDIDSSVTGDITSTSGKGYSLQVYSFNALAMDHVGDITTGGNAIELTGNGRLSVDVTGDITTNATAVKTRNTGTLPMTVDVTGDVKAGAKAFDLATGGATIELYSTGKVDSTGDGITADVKGAGNITIARSGVLTSTSGKGIIATASNGFVDVTTGSVIANGDAVVLQSTSTDVTVTQNGNISSSTGRGVIVTAPAGNVTMTGDGTISTAGAAVILDAKGNVGAVEFTHGSGAITSQNDLGISLRSTKGYVSFDNKGDVTAGTDGIVLYTTGQNTDATVLQYGNVTAGSAGGTRSAISLSATTGNTLIRGQGNLSVLSAGTTVYADTKGNATVSNTLDWKGNITAANGSAIELSTTMGAINLDVTGNVSATVGSGSAAAIQLTSSGNTAIDVDVTGNISRTNLISAINGAGLSINSIGQSKITVNTKGDIATSGSGMTIMTKGDKTVTVNHTGDITAGYVGSTVSDANADGIFADQSASSSQLLATVNGKVIAARDGVSLQSVGNKLSEPHTITQTGSITALRYGISVSNRGGITNIIANGDVSGALAGINVVTNGNSNVTVNAAGKVSGGAAGDAIRLESGGNVNTVTNYGSVTSAAGLAVFSSDSDTSINNYGTLSGNIDLSNWSNSIVNHSGATFAMGTSVDVGAWSTVSSSGLVEIGTKTDGTVQTTALNGSFENTASGMMVVDVAMASGLADKINITNGEAILNGKMKLRFASLAKTSQNHTLVSAVGGGFTNNGVGTTNTFALTSFDKSDAENAILTISGFDFAPKGVTGNGAKVGAHLTDAFPRAGTGLTSLTLALANLTSLSDGQAALNQLSPEVELDRQAADVRMAQGFSETLMSCPTAVEGQVWASEGACTWARAQDLTLSADAGNALSDFDATGTRVAAGGQFGIGPDLWLGLALGVTESNLATGAGATSKGQALEAGLSVKYANGPLLLAASVSGSTGDFDSSRAVAFDGFTDNLTASRSHAASNARLRAAYSFGAGAIYVKPSIDVMATRVTSGAATETGGNAALSYRSQTTNLTTISPGLELGVTNEMSDDWQNRSWLRVRQSSVSQDAQRLSAAFAGADGGAADFTVTGVSESKYTTVSLGVDLMKGDTSSVQVSYDRAMGDVTDASTLSAKLTMRF